LLAWAFRVVCASALGRLSEIAEVTSELREVGRRDGSALAALFLSASEVMEIGFRDPSAAIAQQVRLLEPARQLMPAFMQAILQGIAVNQLRVGDFAAAVATLEPLLGVAPVEVLNRAYLTLALVGAGEAPRALAEARRAIALAEERGLPTGTPLAFIALARATLLAEGAAARREVERALERAEEMVAEHGLLPVGCDILEARAALARALGDEAARSRCLIEAERRYTEMGAPGYAALIAQERAS
jgi:tetratricopeptide (TPR) repeat protein